MFFKNIKVSIAKLMSKIIISIAAIYFVQLNQAQAEIQIYLREYTYQASEADSKITARTIALQQVKRILLNELGIHISALVKQQNTSDGSQISTEEIQTLSAGVTSVEILDEKWDGVVYVLKAQIKADPNEVLRSLHKMLDSEKKQSQISQLGSNLSKIQAENIKISESLIQSKKETDAALAEIARLKKELQKKQTNEAKKSLQTAYKKQTENLKHYAEYDAAVTLYDKGNYQEAFKAFKLIAEQGVAKAQYKLGVMNYYAEGSHHDSEQAEYWFHKAAEQGIVKAQTNLGLMYVAGDGVQRDMESAIYWFKKAAEKGDVKAQHSLGVMYSKEQDLPHDYKQAVFWFRKAAEQGDANAQYELGLSYAVGLGVPQNLDQAEYWTRKAAKQGNENAIKLLKR